MAAPVQPQQSGQPGQGRVIPGSGSPSQTTQQTNAPQGQSTEGQQPAQPGASVTPPSAPQEPTREQRLLASQEALIREQQQELTRLRQGQQRIEGRVAAIESPPPSRDEQNQRFWKDPVGVMNDLIQSELKKTVEPINQMIHGQRAETEYDRMKKNLAQEFQAEWPHIEGQVDQFVQAAAAQGNPVTPELLNVAALAATGAYHRGMLPGAPVPTSQPSAPPPAPPAPAQRNDMNVPPHLRPSAPPTPAHEREQPKQLRQLTENEKRLARERGMSDADFLSWIDVPPDQVITSQIGRQPKS